jgi:hypothetical protein
MTGSRRRPSPPVQSALGREPRDSGIDDAIPPPTSKRTSVRSFSRMGETTSRRRASPPISTMLWRPPGP